MEDRFQPPETPSDIVLRAYTDTYHRFYRLLPKQSYVKSLPSEINNSSRASTSSRIAKLRSLNNDLLPSTSQTYRSNGSSIVKHFDSSASFVKQQQQQQQQQKQKGEDRKVQVVVYQFQDDGTIAPESIRKANAKSVEVYEVERTSVGSSKKGGKVVIPVPTYSFNVALRESVFVAEENALDHIPQLLENKPEHLKKYLDMFTQVPKYLRPDRDPDLDIILLETYQILTTTSSYLYTPEKEKGKGQPRILTDKEIDGAHILPQTVNYIEAWKEVRDLPPFPSETPGDETDSAEVDEVLTQEMGVMEVTPEFRSQGGGPNADADTDIPQDLHLPPRQNQNQSLPAESEPKSNPKPKPNKRSKRRQQDLLSIPGPSIPIDPNAFITPTNQSFLVYPTLTDTVGFWKPEAEHELREGVDGQNELFCPRAGCRSFGCNVHVCDGAEAVPLREVPGQINPKVESTILKPIKPCSDDCFLHSESLMEEPEWTDIDIAVLMTLFSDQREVEEGLRVCELVDLFEDKSCAAIGRQIQDLLSVNSSGQEVRIPPTPGSPAMNQKGKGRARIAKKPKRKELEFEMEKTLMDPHPICNHPGESCAEAKLCVCRDARLRCEYECYCPPNCPRRFKGCSCPSHPDKPWLTVCGTNSCPCFLNNRECDPAVCRPCGASSADFTPVGDHESKTWRPGCCRNIGLLSGEKQVVRVGVSLVPGAGYGLFAGDQGIQQDALICEYVAELVNHAEGLKRGEITVQTGRNYAFEVDRILVLDGAPRGNQARFVNEAREGAQVNCEAWTRNVLGDHRIALRAARYIKPGEELFLNYGDEFHLGASPEKKASAMKKQKV